MTCRELLERMRTPGASRADKQRLFRDIDAFLAQGCDAEKLREALEAQKAAHDYRYGPAGEEAETAEEMNAFMLKAQELDNAAWRLTRAALSSPAQGGKA